MSIYYGCRFDNIILDLSEKPEFIQWLEDICYNDDTDPIWWITNILPRSMKKFPRIEYLGNCITSGLLHEIELDDISNVKLNLCIGNKNKDNDIEGLIYTLSPLIKSGRIYFDNELTVKEIDYRAIRIGEFPVLPTVDIKIPNEYYKNNEDASEIFEYDLMFRGLE